MRHPFLNARRPRRKLYRTLGRQSIEINFLKLYAIAVKQSRYDTLAHLSPTLCFSVLIEQSIDFLEGFPSSVLTTIKEPKFRLSVDSIDSIVVKEAKKGLSPCAGNITKIRLALSRLIPSPAPFFD